MTDNNVTLIACEALAMHDARPEREAHVVMVDGKYGRPLGCVRSVRWQSRWPRRWRTGWGAWTDDAMPVGRFRTMHKAINALVLADG